MKSTKGHLYRITVEHVEDNKGNALAVPPLSFEARNHDDLPMIADRIRAKQLFEADDATAFAIGLKLFREVMLNYRGHEVFKELDPPVSEFMKALKKL